MLAFCGTLFYFINPFLVPEDLPSLFDKSTFDFWAFKPEEIARQLTLIEWAHAKLVRPNEFYKQAWTKRDAKKKAPGNFYLERVCESVSARCRRVRERTKYVTKKRLWRGKSEEGEM